MFKKIILTAFFIFTCVSLIVPVQAALNTVIYINGIEIESDTEPVLKNDSNFVPIRVIAETLNCTVDYKDNTVIIKKDGITIEMKINDQIAIVNGKTKNLPAAPFITNNRTMVPLRFISENLNCQVLYSPGYEADGTPNHVKIYSTAQVALKSSNLSISSKYFTHYEEFKDEEMDVVSVSANYIVPQFHGLKDKASEDAINSELSVAVDEAAAEIFQVAEEMNTEEYKYNYSYDQDFFFLDTRNNVIPILISGYYYSGGAHGTPYETILNLDLNKSAILELSDIFADKNYEQVLIKEMNDLRAENPEYYNEDVSEVENLDNTSFYFWNDKLVIFYQPYDLAPYVYGFIEFEIPVESISDILKPEYR